MNKMICLKNLQERDQFSVLGGSAIAAASTRGSSRAQGRKHEAKTALGYSAVKGWSLGNNILS